MKGKIKIFLFLIFLLLFFIPTKTKASVLYFESSFNEYHSGDIFLLYLKIDTQKERINAAPVNLSFPKDKLEVLDIIKENSIFTLWPEGPIFSNEQGIISFIGGVPLGFEGEGKILSIAFKVISNKEKEMVQINFSENCLVLLNDGLGTKANLTTKNFSLLLFPTSDENPKNELEEILKKDTIPPQPFQIFLVKTPLLFNGKYFISFFAIDLQSGIDHYEIQEGNGEWKETRYNFYLLKDQTLKSEIKVKAVDKAGNQRISFLKLF